jgi:hypothetical protein
MKYIYYIDEKKFTTNEWENLPHYDISSLDENTPAYENTLTCNKVWCKRGSIWHRLTGPAYIGHDKSEQFWLDNNYYPTKREWVANHPNPDLYFNAIGLKTETDKVLWFLQN